MRQADLFLQTTVCDYVFDKDKIFAYLNLDDNELFIYQRLFDLLARDVPPPDLVVYLQAPTERADGAPPRRARADPESAAARARRGVPARAERGLPALLLPLHRHARCSSSKPRSSIPNPTTPRSTSWCSQIKGMGKGTRYYVARKYKAKRK